MKRIQFYLTPSQGKRLIGKAIAVLPDVQEALKEKTVVVVAGTTNAPVAYELLKQIGQLDGFSHRNFYRGMTVPPGTDIKTDFIGDVVIQKGQWIKGKTVYDVEAELGRGDILFKGANAVNLEEKTAGVLLGNPQIGTVMPISTAVYGRRAKLYVPVGTEKRVSGKISDLAGLVNDPDSEGLRLYPLPGQIVTELDAISILSGAKPTLIASGGTLGAEGGCYYMAEGTADALDTLRNYLKTLKEEPFFW